MRQTQKTPYLLSGDVENAIANLQKRLYELEQKVRGDLDSVSGDIPSMSTQAQAEAGTDEATTMCPKTVLQSIEKNQRCKAWVNFNGSGTVAIRASENVDGITDNATGDYTINLTSGAVEDDDYSIVGSCGNNDNDFTTVVGIRIGTTKTTSALRIGTGFANASVPVGGVFDAYECNVSIFR